MIQATRGILLPLRCHCSSPMDAMPVQHTSKAHRGFWSLLHTYLRVFNLMSSKSSSLRIADIIAAQHLNKSRFHASRYVKTVGGFIVCAECCHTFRKRFAVLDKWIIDSDDTNKSIPHLKCDACKKRILATEPVKLKTEISLPDIIH